MVKFENEMTLKFNSLSRNEAFARSAVAAFCVHNNPTLEEINDIKTAVSEAVTNCIVHAYAKKPGLITIWVGLIGDSVVITVIDEGGGIANIDKAMQPFYATKPEQERSGMGFTVMETFMDELIVESKQSTGGTKITMTKKLGKDRLKMEA
jgi:stage II sporulation protein AB (anti-sigma F factor)